MFVGVPMASSLRCGRGVSAWWLGRLPAASPPLHRGWPSPLQVRRLGNDVRGPPLTKLPSSLALSVQLLCGRPALTYGQFKQRCEAARLFLFWGLVGGLSTALVVSPPRSSYWAQWSPTKWHTVLLRNLQAGTPADHPPSAGAEGRPSPRATHAYQAYRNLLLAEK
eukprot:GHVT01073410.1.p2 GENE.GHVT01073410.1~~GHVT01073410.1.p2  ORF type:complete len:166 (-),score=47.16 GHVT01073410.1:253-750(-)